MMKNFTLLSLLTLFVSVTGFAQTLTSSNLPIVIINTNGAIIQDEPKVQVTMGIIDNGPGNVNNITDPWNDYNGFCGIEFRGNSTQDFDKKTYSIELWTAAGQDTSAQILGMPKEEDWILHAMVIDKTLLRIPFSFYLSQRQGHYAARYKFCEVVLDGDYQGVYIMTEKIKRDGDRVDIAKLDDDDLAGDSVTGGYILRIDWLDDPEGFESNYNAQSGDPMFFQWYYPKAVNIKPAQASYIQSWMAEFEEALFAPTFINSQGKRYDQYLDETSFADFLLLNEVSKNSDGYKLSSYVHKDKDSKDGRIKAGPMWDFDQTYGHSEVCSNEDHTGWTYLQNQSACEDLESMPMWWQELMSDPVFENHLKCRWEMLRQGPLHLDSVNQWIDDNQAFIQPAADRNFVRWQFIGVNIWAQPQPIPQSYQGEIDHMKDWIADRIAWMDSNIPGDCSLDVVGIDGVEASMNFVMFPNPTTGIANFRLDASTVESVQSIEIYNMQGALVQTIAVNGQTTVTADLSQVSNGVYIVKSVESGLPFVDRLVVQ